MKKFFSIAISALLISCSGGDSTGTQNPNEVSFEATGTLTDDNAQDVAEASVDASSTATYNTPAGIFLKKSNTSASNKIALTEGDLDECIETDDSGNSATIDWECVFDHDSETSCDGSGTTVTTYDTDSDFYTIVYNDFSVDCDDEDLTLSCDGSISISTDDAAYCSDLTCETNGESHSFEGCVNANGQVLITVDGETFLSSGLTMNGTCDGISLTVEDSEDSATLTCDVETEDDSCNLEDITSISDCSIEL